MLSYEYKRQVTPAQRTAIDEAIRVAQFIRNKCLRLWMDGQSITATDLPIACSRLAHEFAFVARLNSQARQAAADRA
jgi:putative transposase